MTTKIIDNVDLLLSKLDRTQLEDFIRKECTADGKFQEKFLKLGTKILFNPNPENYAERVADLIEDYTENQIKFMYDNVSNHNFRNTLLQKAWDKSDYDEVLRLAKDGVIHDAEYAGLLKDWHKWEYKVHRQTKNRQKELELARYFFFNGGGWDEKEYYFDAMYAVMKSLIPQDEWMEYVKTLSDKKDTVRLLYIYAQEKMWREYIDFLRKDPSTSNIDEAPEELKKLFADEIVKLYASAINVHFQQAYGREAYLEGVALLRKLIKYGGTKEAEQIVAEQKSRRPPRPALIDELSKLNY